jgi:selenocysteine lyase/cysteine desulfurase
MLRNRRQFVQQAGALTASSFLLPWIQQPALDAITEKRRELDHLSAEAFAQKEDFWVLIQRAYQQSPHFINLENGYFSPQPVEVMEAQMNNIRMINEQPSFYMRKRQWDDKAGVKKLLAQQAGCSPEEIVITRNTTESLDTVIHGLDFEPGSEAIMCDQDYGSMLEAFDQQARRRGLVNKFIELPLHPVSDSEIVERYEKAITDKTKVMLVTHLINITGQVLPVRKICDMAHRHDVQVIVDGAHSFAQLDFKIPDLGADYFGASLHKWLCCPLGAGILYVRKDRIANVWPLFGDAGHAADDIRKLEHIGTHPVSTNLTIAAALRFHQVIGDRRKQERLRYLKRYWTEQVKEVPGITLNTPWEMERSSAIANVAVDGYTPQELWDKLYDDYRIWTVAINRKAVKGIRVTPHLYTPIEHLDQFVAALKELAS